MDAARPSAPWYAQMGMPTAMSSSQLMYPLICLPGPISGRSAHACVPCKAPKQFIPMRLQSVSYMLTRKQPIRLIHGVIHSLIQIHSLTLIKLHEVVATSGHNSSGSLASRQTGHHCGASRSQQSAPHQLQTQRRLQMQQWQSAGSGGLARRRCSGAVARRCTCRLSTRLRAGWHALSLSRSVHVTTNTRPLPFCSKPGLAYCKSMVTE